MHPSEFAVIRPQLERAIDDVRAFLNREKESEKAREDSSKLYDSMEATQTPPEVKVQGCPKLTSEQYAAVEWRTAGGEQITDEQREAILAGVIPVQSMSDKCWAPNECKIPGCWRESSRQVAVWLRKAGETVVADGIDWALDELPGEARHAAEWLRHREATRTLAEYVLTILTNSLESGGMVASGKEKTISQGFLGGEELATALGVDPSRRDAFSQQLSRMRPTLGDNCWHEVSSPRPNSPRYLYRADSPALQQLAEGYKTPKPD